MHRTEAQNNVAGLFTDGPPGTTMGAAWANAVQEEIIKIITESGITLCTQGNETRDQLYNALISSAFWTKMGLTVTKAELNTMTLGGYLKGYVNRPLFSWKDADEIYIGPGMYHFLGTTIQSSVYWDSTLTFKFGPAGSNPDSDALGANDFFYIYLDDSTITDRLLDETNFLAKTTEPTWSDAKHGWYNGLDRCVFAARANASSQIEFFAHDGNLVTYIARFADAVWGIRTGAWSTITLTVPCFTRQALCVFGVENLGNNSSMRYKSTDSPGDPGAVDHEVAVTPAGDVKCVNTMPVVTSVGQQIDVRTSGADNCAVWTDGWYFPIGM